MGFCTLLRPVWCWLLPPFIVCCLEIYLELVSQPICQLTVHRRGLIAQTFSGKTNKIQECETAPQCTVAAGANLKMDVKSIFCALEASDCTKE